MVHLDEVVVDRLRDSDATEIVARGARRLGQPMGRIRRVVAADVEEDAGVELAESRQRPVEVFVGEAVAAGAEDARRGVCERVEEAGRLVSEVDVLPREQPLNAVAEPDDRADPLASVERGLDDAEERAIDDGGRSAGLPDDECSTGRCCQGCISSLPRSVGGGDARRLERPDDRPQESRQIGWTARGYQRTVPYDLLVRPDAAGVYHVVLNRLCADDSSTTNDVRGAEHPAGVADGGDKPALGVRLAHQADHRGASAHQVGRPAAGDHDQVELAGVDGRGFGVNLDRVAVLAGVDG